ncbi:thioesterase II family protein [Microbulbifer sp. GL-2]|uniref:thioesterase II family protein n=1 Tax=Microbulbifer sp. GL-2 TaxID=2591606 RepID=UPI00116248ED|nr:thioesterase domain-containing protein [Microbulbifer sp. GL-2]BBM00791.1 thioesterase [Microbulbifer sp. GL-2]
MSNHWLVQPRKRHDAEIRVFCLPYAGGGVGTYIGWAKELSLGAEMNAIQLPGRGSRIFEPPFTTMEALIEEMVPEIEPYLDRPYIIFGHSLGSRVGLELIYQLKIRGNPEPLRFIASGSLPPSKKLHRSSISDLPREEFLTQVRKFGGMTDDIFNNKELISLLLPALRADFSIADTYKFNRRKLFNCSISVFGSNKDNNVPMSRLSEWGQYFKSIPEIYQFPGKHFFIETHADIVLNQLNILIEKDIRNIKEKQFF